MPYLRLGANRDGLLMEEAKARRLTYGGEAVHDGMESGNQTTAVRPRS
jgi:hypothetical protein